MSDTSAPHPITRPSRRWLMAGSALLGATALVAALTSSHDATAQGAPTSVTATAAQSGSAALARGLPDFADLVEQVGPAVVNIRTTAKVATAARGQAGPDEEMQEFFRRFFGVPMPRRGQPQPDDEDSGGSTPRGVGSGFIVSADGLVMTNAHVIDGADEVIVRLTDKREFKARVVGADKRTDVAVLKIEASGLPTVRFGDVNRLRVGEWVIAIGSPFDLDNTVTAGIVSAKARDTGEMLPFIQTDVAINPGNSGGPLINLDGEMIGINVAVRVGAQGIAFAIPVNDAMEVAAGFFREINTRQVSHGLTVSTVYNGHVPEARIDAIDASMLDSSANIQAGDIIVSIDGMESPRAVDFERALISSKPGDRKELVISRNGTRLPVSLTLKEAGENEGHAIWRRMGIQVSQVPVQHVKSASATYEKGLRVDRIRPGSSAAREGIREGDILVAMHGWRTESVDNLVYILSLQDVAGGKDVVFYILRNEEPFFGNIRAAAQTSANTTTR